MIPYILLAAIMCEVDVSESMWLLWVIGVICKLINIFIGG